MNGISYRYCHFPPIIIQHAVWLYCRFTPGFRDIEELLAERGIEVSYETIRRWVARFGSAYAKRLKRHGFAPRALVTDKWRAYAVAVRELGLTARHHQARWKNNRIESAHVPVPRRECKMQCFRSLGSAQRFLSIHAAAYNHFNTHSHLITAIEHRQLRDIAHSRARTGGLSIALTGAK